MGGIELRLSFGWYPNQNSAASYVSECVIAQGRKNGDAMVSRLAQSAPTTYIARAEDGSFPS